MVIPLKKNLRACLPRRLLFWKLRATKFGEHRIMINLGHLVKCIADCCSVRFNEGCYDKENDIPTGQHVITSVFQTRTQFEQIISFEKGDVFKVKTTLKIPQIFER